VRAIDLFHREQSIYLRAASSLPFRLFLPNRLLEPREFQRERGAYREFTLIYNRQIPLAGRFQLFDICRSVEAFCRVTCAVNCSIFRACCSLSRVRFCSSFRSIDVSIE